MSQTITLPKVIFGTSALVNLYVAYEDKIKLKAVRASIQYTSPQKPIVFDCAGKYGAGLALETLGNCLKTLNAKLVSVHDPEEYVARGQNQLEKDKRYNDIIEAYRVLHELKNRDEVKAIGVASKDWRMIQRIVNDVNLDWVMIATRMTVHSHHQKIVIFMEKLQQRGIIIINAAVFNSGFLIGEDYHNYKLMDPMHD
ncbi:unnamed protein product [Rotaria sordida]|uniref:NADP-dependent oxidoreductase domain-containing protein n=1 Tax=Rotaria sordida TaxID=392033 RepID=A0A819VKI0_9BILA|nr:unnamed protein product [Rotaria sordida]CAF1119524.1 unnamed protein product [Rotaria sordida]CAF3704137.1 unnamed protein product [Rotaria sordida]CAF4110724.1 unnamed protein product [Rotaria sordida]